MNTKRALAVPQRTVAHGAGGTARRANSQSELARAGLELLKCNRYSNDSRQVTCVLTGQAQCRVCEKNMPHESSARDEKKRYDGGYGPVERQRTQAMYDAPEDASTHGPLFHA